MPNKIAFPVAFLLLLAAAGLSFAKSGIARADGSVVSSTTMEKDSLLVLSRERDALLAETPPPASKIAAWRAALTPAGRWPDIDYDDSEPSAWKTIEHLQRVRSLCLAFANPKGPEYGEADVESAASKALDDWLKHRYRNANWWQNEIGVPMLMRDIILLLGDNLTGDQRQASLEVLNQYGRARPGDGANTIWEASLGLDYALLSRDDALAARQSALIAGEIVIGGPEGIQTDDSFYQHGARLQQFHYGAAYLSDTARLAWQLSGTPWEIPEDKVEILIDFILNGDQWMSRSGYTPPGTLDRSVSRPGAQRVNLNGPIANLSLASPKRAKELDAMALQQHGAPPPVGFRAFPRSDFAAYQRPTFSLFVKTLSDRTLPTESINQENQKGHLLSCGDQYILRDGQEYLNLPPVWNWDLLPGVTWAQGAGNIDRQPFTGAVGDGASGAICMDYQFQGDHGAQLSARKFWACHGDIVVSLIGDLRAKNIKGPIRTAMDQCLLRGPVAVRDARGKVSALSDGDYAAQPLRWLYHSGIAYFPIGTSPVAIHLGPATGSWHSINKGYSDKPVTYSVFLPVLEQGDGSPTAASGFAIAACDGPDQAEQIAASAPWRVLRNDSACQAVEFADGSLFAAFYEPGTLEKDGKQIVDVDHPCLYMTEAGKIYLSDPTQLGGEVGLTMPDGRREKVGLPKDGRSVLCGGS